MLVEHLLFFTGLIILIKGADYLIEGSACLARRLSIPPAIIGLTIIAFGTSLPEWMINVTAAIDGEPAISLGNVIGSSIANILLVLGISILIAPLPVSESSVKRELPFSIFSIIILYILGNNFAPGWVPTESSLTRGDGIVMLLLFLIFLAYIHRSFRGSRKKNRESFECPSEAECGGRLMNLLIPAKILVGLFAVVFGSAWVVDGAIYFAQKYHLSEYLISATIIAVGTSLPELVTSFTAARKKESGIAFGNIVGSNIFNVLLVLGSTAVLSDVPINAQVNADILYLVFVSLLLLLFAIKGKKNHLEKWQGAIFLALYATYVIYMIFRL